jgi:hypothetical protein
MGERVVEKRIGGGKLGITGLLCNDWVRFAE